MGANDGARLLMKSLGIKEPVFCYFGSSGASSFFGKTKIIVPKEPWRAFQSTSISDVMAIGKKTPYIMSNIRGGTSRQTCSLQEITSPSEEIHKKIVSEFKKEGYSIVKTEKEIRDMLLFMKDEYQYEKMMIDNSRELKVVLFPGITVYGSQDEFSKKNEVKIENGPTVTFDEQELKVKIEDAAKTYSEIKNGKTISTNEVILDLNNYWALDMESIIKNGGKFMPVAISDVRKIDDYSTVIDILEKYRGFISWKMKK